jgi:hypothetical protein
MTTMKTTTKTKMEWQEEARRQEEVQRHDKQRQRRVKTTNYLDVETNNGAAGGGTAVGEDVAHDKGQQ